MADWPQMMECMKDAGCGGKAIDRAETLYRAGADEELIRCLRACRCKVLEEIHERQKSLDRLDKLIRETKKNDSCRPEGRQESV